MTPTKNEWEEKIRRKYHLPLQGAYIEVDNDTSVWAGDEIIEDIRAEKAASEAETLKKVLEVVDRRTPAPHCSLHDRPKDGTCDACLVNIEIHAAFSDLTDKLTHITKE